MASSTAISPPARARSPYRYVLAGGVVAATLDMTYALRLMLHYFIATTIALVYYRVASHWPLLHRRIPCARFATRALSIAPRN